MNHCKKSLELRSIKKDQKLAVAAVSFRERREQTARGLTELRVALSGHLHPSFSLHDFSSLIAPFAFLPRFQGIQFSIERRISVSSSSIPLQIRYSHSEGATFTIS